MALLLLTVNTGDSAVWDATAEFNGFTNRRILGVGEKWGGWDWRTSLYIQGIEDAPWAQLIVLTDGGDVFFVGKQSELIDKFMRMGHDLVMGAELGCCTGRFHTDPEREPVINFFTSRTPYHIHRFLNGGFIMGRRESVLNLLRNNRGYNDDQEGYIDQLMRNPDLFVLDETQTLCGNYTFDPDIWIQSDGRFTNTLTGESPIVMHFPGGVHSAHHYRMLSADIMRYISRVRKARFVWNIVTIITILIIVCLVIKYGKIPAFWRRSGRTPKRGSRSLS